MSAAFCALFLVRAAGRNEVATPDTSCSALEALYDEFRDPPRRYTVRPYWFWNGVIESRRVAEQIQMMVDPGVYGAFVFPFAGLRTPYLTDAWFKDLGGSNDRSEHEHLRHGACV